MRVTLLTLAWAGLIAGVSVSAGALDSLLVGSELDPDGTARRHRIEIQWLRTDDQGHLNAGVTRAQAGDQRWALATLGASRRLAPEWLVVGRLQAGPGRKAEGRFNYALAALGTIYTLRPGRLFFEGELQTFDIDATRGEIGKLGLTAVPASSASIAVAYIFSVDGDDDVKLVTIRSDLAHGGTTILFGGALGETIPALLDPGGVAGSSVAIEYRQVFVGLRHRNARRTLDVVLDYEEIGASDRASIKLGIQLPWSRLGTGQSR